MRPHRLMPLLLLLAAPLVGGTAAVRADEAHGDLARRIGARLKRAGLAGQGAGIAVLTRGEAPQVVYAREADRPLVPASAAKVLTSAAALDLLGPAYQFTTRLTARGTLGADGALDGDLVLHGGADPNLSGRLFEGDPMAVPTAFAAAVARAGIRRVRGALVLDEGLLDAEYVHPDWSDADRARWYGAPVGGLSFNDNCIDVVLRGAAVGQPAALGLPATAGPWRVRNDVRTRAGTRTAAGGRWVDAGATLQLHGYVAPGRQTAFNVPVPDPARFLGGALLAALTSRGVRVDGGQRRPRDDADRSGGRLVAEHHSTMVRTLEVLNRNSQNLYASLLYKLSGAALDGRGTWASGARAVRAMLERRRIADGGATVTRDGSGLSVRNRTSAAVLVQVLSAFDRDLLRGPLLYASLPVAGESGTLARRLKGRDVKGRVHAKTGTLNDSRARALAGYVDADGEGPGYVFAILLNGPGASHGVIDDIVRELVR